MVKIIRSIGKKIDCGASYIIHSPLYVIFYYYDYA